MGIETIHSKQLDWDDTAWDAFVLQHPAAHPLQLSAWGKLKSEFGWEAMQIAQIENGYILAGAQVLFRKLPRFGILPVRIAYIPKGPLVDWRDSSQVQALFGGLNSYCRKQGALLLKIEPELRENAAIEEQLLGAGFQPSSRDIQPQTTVWLDLAADEDTLLARMKQKWRYNVRLAARKGVTVREGAAADLATFAKLMETTGQRNEFGVHAAAYYRRFWELFSQEGNAVLLIAEHEQQMLAALMVATAGNKAYYLYGASSNVRRNLMPGHVLQWETMRWAKTRGCIAYDLWGVPDEVGLDAEAEIPDPPIGLWGVWRFKRGFGGEVVRYTGAWDKTYLPGLSLLVR
ncbi:MAG: peptidoglycan bridge formation glycyltransferase FemA/FemB family protein [Chloroflexi bacterium]|nr:peptidoglycan bridge formation glycyltransferase FemA/FemB family protein [Chloroflexota bacterium]